MRRKTNGSPNNEGIFDVNMTPLIDVSLVLVVILMVATPMVFQSAISVRSAAASARAGSPPVRTDRVEISVLSDSLVTINRVTVPRADLARYLEPMLTGRSGQVVVQCADTVPHGTFVGVLDVARACGATQIAVTGG